MDARTVPAPLKDVKPFLQKFNIGKVDIFAGKCEERLDDVHLRMYTQNQEKMNFALEC